MTPPRCRRFTISDAIILVAATAIGLSQVRGILGELGTFNRSTWKLEQHLYALKLFAVAVPILTAWTVAFLLLRLRRPRPGLRRLVRQPGMAACYAVLVPLLIILAYAVTISLFTGESMYQPDTSFKPLFYNSEAMASAVLGAWLLLWLGGLGRAEPGWIDRMGRTIGVLWIARPLLFYLTEALPRLL
jgi:hypothetical protein